MTTVAFFFFIGLVFFNICDKKFNFLNKLLWWDEILLMKVFNAVEIK